MFRQLAALIVTVCAILLAPAIRAQSTINLNSVIGISGANAASVSGAGNAVNFTGYASNAGATTLTALGSSGSSAFDFNVGFSDTLDRATGSSAGAPNVFVDHKYDSSSTSALILDTNNDGLFSDESLSPLPGFGMHGDTFITFDLDVIRANHSLSLGTPLTLTGAAGIANAPLSPTSGAIIVDSSQRAVFDWSSGAGNTFSTYTINLAGSDRYLTFIGLSGQDGNNFYAHVGYANVQLAAVPEPSAYAALAGLAALGLATLRRRKT